MNVDIPTFSHQAIKQSATLDKILKKPFCWAPQNDLSDVFLDRDSFKGIDNIRIRCR
ncbi:hypothetical protein D3C87_1128610 [compost metagenome]